MNSFSVASAFAAYGDWWNRDGLTNRDRCRGTGRKSISQQLHNLGYSPACGGNYIEEDDEEAQDIYLDLVRKWEGEAAAQEEESNPPWVACST